MSQPTVWVVEYWHLDRWVPIQSVLSENIAGGLVRNEGRIELRNWRAENPDDKFRLVPYTPRDGK